MNNDRKKIVTINYEDEFTGEMFTGTLLLNKKSIEIENTIRIRKAERNAGLSFTSKEDESHANVEATVFSVFANPSNGAEKWFDTENMTRRLLMHLYKVHTDFEVSFWRLEKRNEYYRLIGEEEKTGSKENIKRHEDTANGMVREDISHAENKSFVPEVSVD